MPVTFIAMYPLLASDIDTEKIIETEVKGYKKALLQLYTNKQI